MDTLDLRTAAGWRSWLRTNHASKGIWLVFYNKSSGEPSISYEDALDEALAFGWIDSIIRKLDDQKYARKFTPRSFSKSNWSESNVERAKQLIKEGRKTKWGLEAIERRVVPKPLPKPNLETIPKDLQDALEENEVALRNFASFAPSHRRRYLMWISSARRPETRKKRVEEAVSLIEQNTRNLLK